MTSHVYGVILFQYMRVDCNHDAVTRLT